MLANNVNNSYNDDLFDREFLDNLSEIANWKSGLRIPTNPTNRVSTERESNDPSIICILSHGGLGLGTGRIFRGSSNSSTEHEESPLPLLTSF